MPQRIIEWVNLGVAGLLSIMWFDIRNIRKKNQENDLNNEKARQAAREEIFNLFLTKDKHDLLCENSGLRIKEHVSTEIKASEKRILEAINKTSIPSN